MGLLDRLLRRKVGEADADAGAAPCPHIALGPRWDSADDIGDESKAISFRCEACGTSFPREEGERLRAAEAERLRATLSRDT